jgi:phosphatidylglycerophosphatase A
MGTLATLPVLILASSFGMPPFLLAPFIFACTVYSCFMAHLVQKERSVHDPGWIVMDEALGMALTWMFIQNGHWSHLALCFGLFRFFDIFKIWPATYFDRDVTHGAGTILDDIVSGVYAGLVYLLIEYFNILPVS